MAVAARDRGENRHSIAVIGDGAMSAGMAFEAMNNAGVAENVRLLVVLNDNDMSISPAVGALNRYLARLLSGKFYAAAKQAGRQVLKHVPPMLELARKLEEHAKGMLVPGHDVRGVRLQLSSGRSTATTSTRWCRRCKTSGGCPVRSSCTWSRARGRATS